MAEQKTAEQLDAEWWDAWWREDFSWAGLAKKKWAGWFVQPDGSVRGDKGEVWPPAAEEGEDSTSVIPGEPQVRPGAHGETWVDGGMGPGSPVAPLPEFTPVGAGGTAAVPDWRLRAGVSESAALWAGPARFMSNAVARKKPAPAGAGSHYG